MENVKENIIKAASEKMRQVGIKSISVDDICRQLGISKKTFYVYFETKEQLIQSLLRQHEANMEESVHKQAAGKTILDLMLGCMSLASTIKDVRKAPPLFYDLQKYYPQLFHEHLNHMHDIATRLLQHYLKQGQDEGFFRADLDIEKTARILSFMHQQMLNILPQVPEEQRSQVRDKVTYGVDIIMRGIISDEGKRKVMERVAMIKNEQ